MFGLTLITTLRLKALKDRLRGAEADNERLRLTVIDHARAIELYREQRDKYRQAWLNTQPSRAGMQPREQAARQQAAAVAQVRDQHETRDNYIPVGLWSANPAPDAAAPMVPSPSFTMGGGGDYAGAGATGSWSSDTSCASSDSSSSSSSTSSDSGSCTSSGD